MVQTGCVQRETGAQVMRIMSCSGGAFHQPHGEGRVTTLALVRVLMREAYSDALELTEAIYELCHHISDPGVLKLHVPHPLESLIWPPVIPPIPASSLHSFAAATLRGRPHVAVCGKRKGRSTACLHCLQTVGTKA